LIRREVAHSSERLKTSATDYKTIIESLSAREFDVLLLLAKGLIAHKIAGELCLGYKTIANYGMQIRSKPKVSSVAELAHTAIGLGVMKKVTGNYVKSLTNFRKVTRYFVLVLWLLKLLQISIKIIWQYFQGIIALGINRYYVSLFFHI